MKTLMQMFANEDKGVAQVTAKIPLAELFGYTNDLRSATAGTASFSMEFSHYAEAPHNVAEEIIHHSKR